MGEVEEMHNEKQRTNTIFKTMATENREQVWEKFATEGVGKKIYKNSSS